MYFERKIEKQLKNWREDLDKKPLLLRGARQVGKSSTVRNFASSFETFIEINFDFSPDYVSIFERSLDPEEICKEISFLTGKTIRPGKTLLFFDEIQLCPKAITSLRYFYERMPELHVIASGSLLEFALTNLPSFGVGRIRSVFMFPFSFSEFLQAIGQGQYNELIANASASQPIFDIAHQKLIEFFKLFIIVGGMPQAVATYAKTGNLLKVQKIVGDLVNTYQTDFAKYKARVPEYRVNLVLREVVSRVGQKFSYVDLTDKFNHSQIKETLSMLQMAGLIYSVVHTSANGLPIGAEANPKKTKYLILDTAIYMHILGYKSQEVLLSSDIDFVNKGALAELHTGIELVKAGFQYKLPELFYWHREEKNADAELDYLIQKNEQLLPIEVKAGKAGKMKSLHIFLKEKQWQKAIKVSLENFEEVGNVKTVPLYAVSAIVGEEEELDFSF
jgi:uncharacterized protein